MMPVPVHIRGSCAWGSGRSAILPAYAVRGTAQTGRLAQVLIRDPKILLMDEPFAPLDAQTVFMGNLLLDLWNADRKAVLLSTIWKKRLRCLIGS